MLSTEQNLNASLAEAKEAGRDYEPWAVGKRGSNLQMALAVEAIFQALYRPAPDGIEALYQSVAARYLDIAPLPSGVSPKILQPLCAVAAMESAGILRDVFNRLSLSIENRNGCVVVIDTNTDRFLTSLPLAEWKEKIGEALQEKSAPRAEPAHLRRAANLTLDHFSIEVACGCCGTVGPCLEMGNAGEAVALCVICLGQGAQLLEGKSAERVLEYFRDATLNAR